MLKDWWYERTPREQYFLGIGGIVGVFLIVYLLIWDPITSHTEQLRNNVIKNSALLVWMQSANERLNQYRAEGYVKKTPSTQSLLVTVEQSLVSEKLSQYVNSTQQLDARHIKLSFQKVPFDMLIDWLETLWQKNDIVVNSISVQNTQTTGLVSASVNLTN